MKAAQTTASKMLTQCQQKLNITALVLYSFLFPFFFANGVCTGM